MTIDDKKFSQLTSQSWLDWILVLSEHLKSSDSSFFYLIFFVLFLRHTEKIWKRKLMILFAIQNFIGKALFERREKKGERYLI